MTDFSLMVTPETTSFDERIEMLARELELAIKWERPCVLFVVYGSEFVRNEVQSALDNRLVDLGQRTTNYIIKDEVSGDIVAHLQNSKDTDKSVFSFQGLSWGSGAHANVYTMLALHKGLFVDKHIRAIFWLTRNEIVDLAHQAPDFWVFRQRSIEFVETPKADRMFQQAVEETWQEAGEYGSGYEDSDEKIALQETMLAELPTDPESCSIRAHLLLSLGVLNWRIGEFEKAGTRIQEALQLAEQFLDAWFQAECFNALALLKSSLDRVDEAIEAYHHALQLAPDQIFVWNNLGNLFLKIRNPAEAMTAFQTALQARPDDPVAWNGLGNAHYLDGCVSDAIGAYRKSIQCLPTYAQPWCGLGNAFAETGRNEEAMKAYQKAIELNGKSATPWLELARLHARQDHYMQAAQAYQNALGVDGTSSELWNELGVLHLQHSAHQQAEECFLKATELDRTHARAFSNLGVTLTRQGRSKESVSILLRSIDLFTDPRDQAISWNRLGDAYRQLNDYDNAIAAYQTADMLEIGTTGVDRVELPKQPRFAPNTLPEVRTAAQVFSDTPYWLFDPSAESADRTSQDVSDSRIPQSLRVTSEDDHAPAISNPSPVHAEAATTLPAESDDPKEQEDAIADSTNAAVWNEKGNVHFKQGAIEEAINAYNKAIQFDTEFGWPYCNLAQAYVALGQFTEAILLYQRSIELLETDQDKAICWNGLGNVHRRMSNYADAVKAYQKAAELDPHTAGMREGVEQSPAGQLPVNSKSWNDLGELFFKTGAYEESIQAFEKAISLDPLAGWPLSNLARSLAAQGKYGLAIPLYQKSIELMHEDKDKAGTWNRLGNVYRKLNDYEHAIQAYQTAVALTDEDSALLTRTRFSLLSNLAAD